MNFDYNSYKCQPALIYVILAIATLVISILINMFVGTTTAGGIVSMSLSQLCMIAFVSLIFMGACNINMTLAWVLLICPVVSFISFIIGIMTQGSRAVTGA